MDVSDLHTFKLATLKQILREMNLPTNGRKTELINRLMESDPSGKWMEAAGSHQNIDEDEEQDECSNLTKREKEILEREKELLEQEAEIARREAKLLERELQAAREEIARMRMSNSNGNNENQGPRERNTVRQLSLNHIFNLLNDFDGTHETFRAWENQVQLLKDTYKLTDEETKVMMSEKIKGKAQRWFHSDTDHLRQSVEDLLGMMRKMYDRQTDCLVRRKKFEDRVWRYGESFTDYYHEKIILANRVPISSTEIVSYLIRGIPNENLRNQVRLQKFATDMELLESMEEISLPSAFKPEIRKDGRMQHSTSGRNEGVSSYRMQKQEAGGQQNVSRCYNCGEIGHIATSCTRPKLEKGACYTCGNMGHQVRQCPNRERKDKKPSEQVSNVVEDIQKDDEFRRKIRYELNDKDIRAAFELETQVDSGSPISFVKESLIPSIVIENVQNNIQAFMGINESMLEIVGTVRMNVVIGKMKRNEVTLYVVPDKTMRSQVILGRDLMKELGYKLVEPEGIIALNSAMSEIMNIDISNSCAGEEIMDKLSINSMIPDSVKVTFRKIFKTEYLLAERPQEPKVKLKLTINLLPHSPFHFNPRRLSFSEKIQLQDIIDKLMAKGIIRASESEYASPIVIVRKKNGEARLCVDYRVLNKYIIRDNYPLPVIEDHITALYGKRYYSKLDLKDGFHQIQVHEDAIKYTAFTTPIGQYEYLGMPFGLKTATAKFSRFVNAVLEELIKTGHVLAYVDDFLIATDSIEDHLKVLSRVFELLVQNKLELRIDKCNFLATEIEYLGYLIKGNTVRPLDSGIAAVRDYPVTQNQKDVQSFIGLTSYFRKFIEGFAIIAAPLYKLLRKDNKFNFGEAELNAFMTLKAKLIESPVLAIYNPNDETELHTDASTLGFGAVLLQRKTDNKFHPVFYFSKRTTETESKYHSFELETLAIIYALKRFRIYLYGIKFKIVTDCNALKLTLEKRHVNPKIERWAMELLAYDYETEHRLGVRMKHVDAFSRIQSVLVVEANSLETNLALSQGKDSAIKELQSKLQSSEDKLYEMRGGIVYRKVKDKLRFYVPAEMENQIMHKYHDEFGHIGVEKTCNLISQNYFIPQLNQKVKVYISNCLTCIAYSPKTGKGEGRLHSIPKGEQPFVQLHIDHYGPIDKKRLSKQYVLLAVDGFTKFVKLYPVKNTTSKEAIVCLSQYFCNYSRPRVIISDRGTCFTSAEFKDFLKDNNIEHILVATATPKANGQVERINRTLGPMLGKLTDSEKDKCWYKVIRDVEYAINNTINKSSGQTPSKLLFGVKQKGKIIDGIAEYLESDVNIEMRDLEMDRTKAAQNIQRFQKYNKDYFDKHHKEPHKFHEGSYVMIKNFENKPGAPKKLIPCMKGPYKVVKVLRNDRYVIRSLDEYDGTVRPYEGTWSAENMRPWREI